MVVFLSRNRRELDRQDQVSAWIKTRTRIWKTELEQQDSDPLFLPIFGVVA